MITTAVIGVGRMGTHHARIYTELPDAKLVGLADIDPGAAKTASEGFGRKAYLDYREMLEVEHPQAVSVTVPASFHEEIVMAALRSGADVIVEKPLALTVESGARMVECARQEKRRLMVGHIERFNPVIQKLKNELQNRQFGQIYQIVCRRMSPFPDRIRDVGVVIDLALHDLDLLRFLTDQLPVRVYAEIGRYLQTVHEDSLIGFLHYQSGLTALLEVNWLSPVRVREVWVYAEKGSLCANSLTQELTVHITGQEPASLPVLQDNPLRLELQAFLRVLQGETTLIASAQEGLSALRLAFELLESGKNQEPRTVSYDPTP